MSHGGAAPLHHSSQSDIDEIENLINDSVQSGPATVLPACPPSPPRASIPVSSFPFVPSALPPLPFSNKKPPPAPPPHFAVPSFSAGSSPQGIAADGFGPPANTLTEPIRDTVKRDLTRIATNLKLVVFPNPNREDPGKALRDWDLWGPFFFIIFLGLVLSWSASVKKGKGAGPSAGVSQVLDRAKVGGVCCRICSTCSWCYNSDVECFAAGWAHNLLSESESSGILPVSSGRWSSNLLAGNQCHHQDDGCVGYIFVEFLGCVPFHEHSCVAAAKGPGPVPGFPHVYIRWLSDCCH
ncbi:uncharacterized protein LOC103720424 isoform X1 [Phoenix dactylifera]|uniref:Uncharacterized protein LOC103720424 isoform X1 n=1 Tax=Phoenix dactylifera TaxID=42345 RepID=A0A8B9AII5_PHODC|nr:uncharacterized protein LOC103720424 isoform X1 [Phoenix dactylifera]XP_038983809.1 uncharacterized protein LOC103720424 isoform X1 [Phoenix dactylifera]